MDSKKARFAALVGVGAAVIISALVVTYGSHQSPTREQIDYNVAAATLTEEANSAAESAVFHEGLAEEYIARAATATDAAESESWARSAKAQQVLADRDNEIAEQAAADLEELQLAE